MYEAVLFDLDDTLCDITAAREAATQALADRRPGTRESEIVARFVTPNPETVRLIADLRTRVPVGIVTNGNPRAQQEKLRRCLPDCTLDTILISGALGVRKPDPAIFRRALGELNARPEHTLFVGDDPVNDMEGAATAGLATAWLSRGRDADDLPCAVDHLLHDLAELREIVLC